MKFFTKLLILLVCASNSLALTFSVVPTTGMPLPTQVVSGRTVMAYYTITNLTGNDFTIDIRRLPTNTAVESDAGYCNSSLAAHGNCTLKLAITGVAQGGFLVCVTGTTNCSPATTALNVAVGAGNATLELTSADPLTVPFNGDAAVITVKNNSTVYVNNITPPTLSAGLGVTGTPDPNCQNLAPGATCSYSIQTTSSQFIGGTASIEGGNSSNIINFNVTTAALWIAASSYKDTNNLWHQLVLNSYDNGVTWGTAVVPTGISLPSGTVSAAINQSFCNGSGPSAICMAVGNVKSGSLFQQTLINSLDGGSSWQPASITLHTGVSASLRDITCNGSGSSAMCISVGTYTDNSNVPHQTLLTSADGGATWQEVTQLVDNSALPSGILSNTVCHGNGSDAICVAIGPRKVGSVWHHNILLSLNGGTSWQIATFINDQTYNILTSTAATCNPTDTSIVCMAAGSYLMNGIFHQDIITSQDGGLTWQAAAGGALPSGKAVGVANNFTCSGSDCMIAGYYQSNDNVYHQTILISADYGVTWNVATGTFPSGIASPNTNQIACNGNQCMYPSSYVDNSNISHQSLLTSSDGGLTWASVSLPVRTQNAGLQSTTCNGSGITAVCMTVGQYADNSGAVVYQNVLTSLDGGVTWNNATLRPEQLYSGINAALGFVTCNGTGTTAHCSALGAYIGSDNVTWYPGLVTSLDGGVTWGQTALRSAAPFPQALQLPSTSSQIIIRH